jgi:hypothetical protein
MKLINKFVIMFVIAISISGCATNILVESLNHDTNNGLAIGKFVVKMNGENITSHKTGIFFNEYVSGKFSLEFDDREYYIFKLPAGINNMARLFHITNSYKVMKYNFNTSETSFNIDALKINYIGDLVIEWNDANKNFTASEIVGGAIGGFLSDKETTGGVTITINNNIDQAKKFLEGKFNEPIEIVFSPIRNPEQSH